MKKMAVKQVSLENVRIGFRNFEGREGPFNKEGDRSFAVFLDVETADALAREGWNIKYPKDREGDVDPDGDTREPYLQVAAGFDSYPAQVVMISNGNPVRLSVDEVGMLDWAEIENVDLVLRPYEWEVRGNRGVKAYLKAGYFTIVVDKFAAKHGLV